MSRRSANSQRTQEIRAHSASSRDVALEALAEGKTLNAGDRTDINAGLVHHRLARNLTRSGIAEWNEPGTGIRQNRLEE